MSDQPPHFPPPEPIPEGPKARTTEEPDRPPAQAPPLLQVTPPARSPYAPVQRTLMQPRRRAIITSVVVVASLAFIGGVVALGLRISHDLFPVIATPLTGSPGAPLPDLSLDCPEMCFYPSDAELTAPSPAELRQLGLTEAPIASYGTSTLVEEFRHFSQGWESDKGTPDECFFAYVPTPVAVPLTMAPEMSNGSVVSTLVALDAQGSQLQQSARTFTTSTQAEEHMAGLIDLIAGCTHYSIGAAESGWEADLTPAPALAMPDTVSALGWVEDSQSGRFYAFDLLRANMVVRVTLSTQGRLSETDYREFVSSQAMRLSDLEIEPYEFPVDPVGCEIRCLTAEDISTLSPAEAALSELGVFVRDPAYTPREPSTAGAYDDDARTVFVTGQGKPDACYFALSPASVSNSSPSYVMREDDVRDLGRYVDGPTTLTQTTRQFGSELYASRFTGTLTSPIKQCAEYTYAAGGTTRTVLVSPTAFETTEGVRSDAWTEKEGETTRTLIDLQFRNVVTRIVVTRDPDSAVTDAQIASFVFEYSKQFAELGD